MIPSYQNNCDANILLLAIKRMDTSVFMLSNSRDNCVRSHS